jgi:cell division protein FtsN
MGRPMGRTLRILVPCALGLLAAFLVSCGDTSKLIPGDDAAAINQNIDAASGASGDGRCSRAAAAVDRAETHVQQLPSSVDSKLRADLEQGIARLRAAAATECSENKPETTATTESTESTESTETATTESTETQTTETQPTETQPTETQPTETQQTDTSGGDDQGGGTGGTSGGGSGGTQAP